MAAYQELFEIARRLKAAGEKIAAGDVGPPIDALESSAKSLIPSFSGSWLGYHSRVYFARFAPAPPGAHFSQEWGLQGNEWLDLGSKGDWVEYDPDDVKAVIRSKAGNPDLGPARSAAQEAEKTFAAAKSEVMSIVSTEMDRNADTFIERLRSELDQLDMVNTSDAIQELAPNRSIMTRDSLALGQGTWAPPHIEVLAEALSLKHAFGICNAAAAICEKLASHLERKAKRDRAVARVGTNVFIGHGRSLLWRELKDFIEGRLGLPWDEFNRVPVAGVTNISRLSEMLDAAAVALLVMTGEDELADGKLQARMNVAHEAGLFQGRLGFSKAIVLLEEGCEAFSNIDGLGQIRFPKNRIGAAFEDVRRVLEREGLIPESGS